jgi:hypothetical protein
MSHPRIYHLLITCSLLPLSGCYADSALRAGVVVPVESHSAPVVVHRATPPPHAPAHGYQYQQHGNQLRFDASFGAYVIVNQPGLYFYNDRYMRYYNNGWQTTNRLEGVWAPARSSDIPHKLRKSRRHAREERREERREYRREERREHRGEYRETPRHGDRRRYNGHDMSFDSDIGAYAVNNRPGIYVHNNRYLRKQRGVWQSSNRLNGTWRRAENEQLPRKLKAIRKLRKEKH